MERFQENNDSSFRNEIYLRRYMDLLLAEYKHYCNKVDFVEDETIIGYLTADIKPIESCSSIENNEIHILKRLFYVQSEVSKLKNIYIKMLEYKNTNIST